jgi:hypothetical protein
VVGQSQKNFFYWPARESFEIQMSQRFGRAASLDVGEEAQ